MGRHLSIETADGYLDPYICVSVCVTDINSMIPGRCNNFKSAIAKHMLEIKFMNTHCNIALRSMPQNISDDKSASVPSGTKPLHDPMLS